LTHLQIFLEDLAMQRLPGLSALRVFEAAARHLSFSRAAEELGVTPAAVSNQIRTLEDQMGVQLFWRTSRTVRLTAQGLTLLTGVTEAFATLSRTFERIGGSLATTLGVSMSASFAAKWLVPRLDGFRQLHPGIDLRIEVSDNIIDFVTSDIQVAVRFGNGIYPNLRSDRLFEEFVFPVCSPSLLDGPSPLRTPSDLRHRTLIHLDWQARGETWPDWRMWLLAAGAKDVDPSHGIRLSLFSLVSQAAIAGQGVALGNTSLVGDDLEAGRLVKPFDLSLRAPAEFAYHVVSPLVIADRPLVVAFRDWVLSESRGESAGS
jgi:LysR family transcriptional regulator, glycine cleavage system transcriptional activator